MVKPKPLHVDVSPMEWKVMGFNIFPTICWMFNKMPDEMRRSAMSKTNAPKPGKPSRDMFDITGQSPYEKEEVVAGKLWAITYRHEDKGATDRDTKKQMKAFGMDPTAESYQAKCLKAAAQFGPRAVATCKKDIEKAVSLFQKETYSEEELKEVMTYKLRMFVVRLTSGSLLLYTPCRIREDAGLKSWLDNLGRVDWIVLGSSSHTLSLPGVIAQYPEAKILGTNNAQDKLVVINALPRDKFDYNAAKVEDLESINQELSSEGVSLFYVEGDVGTTAIVAVAHGVLLNVDLVYGRHDGGAFDISAEEWQQYKPEHSALRLFFLAHCSKPNSPNGVLANYRFLMMDPAGLGAMNYDQPAPDGSSCQLMAKSLRQMLNLDFQLAYDVHSGRMEREDFRKTINANWSWLDGESLI